MADSGQHAPARGDEAELFREYNDELVRLGGCNVRCHTRDVIEDACSFARAEFLRHQPSRERNWRGWLYRTAQRQAWLLTQGLQFAAAQRALQDALAIAQVRALPANQASILCDWALLLARRGELAEAERKYQDAEACLVRLEENLRLVERGRITIPDGADLGLFLLSDGKLEKPVEVVRSTRLAELWTSAS